MINDPRQYVLSGMAEMGLANFLQSCAEACSVAAGRCSAKELAEKVYSAMREVGE